MQRALLALALVGLAGGTAGCGALEDVQAVAKEFSKDDRNKDEVTSGAPLTMPPDFAIRPPSTSTAPGSEATARRTQVVLRTGAEPGTAAPAAQPRGRVTGPTAGERDLLSRAGYNGATSDVVRKTVDIEADRRSTGEKGFVDRVLKYDPKAKPTADDAKGARDATGDKPVIKRPGEF